MNSEKYAFTQDVLKAADDLFESFCAMKRTIQSVYNRYLASMANPGVDCANPLRLPMLGKLWKNYGLRWNVSIATGSALSRYLHFFNTKDSSMCWS